MSDADGFDFEGKNLCWRVQPALLMPATGVNMRHEHHTRHSEQHPRGIARAAGRNREAARIGTGVALYAQQAVSLGKGAEIAGLGVLDLNDELAARGIPMHYGQKELNSLLPELRQLAGAGSGAIMIYVQQACFQNETRL